MVNGVLRLLFVAYVVATALHIGIVMAHEPFAFDAWNMALETGAEPYSFSNFLEYGASQYTHSNPRVGQWFTYLAYKLEYFAVIVTPIVYLGLSLAITVLGLGRFPSWKRGRDLALYAITLGVCWFALPRIGMIMFCRAYSMNYVLGLAIQLWFLVPLRLRPSGEGGMVECVPYFFLGVIAGACNEHTGPTLVLAMLVLAGWRYQQSDRRPDLALAGALGVLVGFAMIFFAPGQGERYDGLATKVGFLGRLLQRGITNNLDIFQGFVTAAAPTLGLIAIALAISARDANRGQAPALLERAAPPPGGAELNAQRQPLYFLGWALLAGSVISATVFVSPKLGPRFYLASCALLVAAFIGLADAVLTSTRRFAPFVVLAVLASIYAGARTIPLYLRLKEASDERMAALAASTPGTVFTADAFDQVEDSWWFIGDDFRDIKKRELVANYFGLAGVVHRAVDLHAPLGVSDVRLVPRYAVSPPRCLDEAGGFELGTFRALDAGSVQKAMLAGIERLRLRLGGRGTLDRFALEVDFLGDRPKTPRPTIVVGRWTPTRFDAWAGVIERAGSLSRTRRVVLPDPLRTPDVEVVIWQVGGTWKSLGTGTEGKLEYEPWRRGPYWALACRASECFVIAATRLL
ncbi:MAG: DUF6056 family protein [Kofleriaceae bacterium]|nr:DUF6056 family protein [Kofleriaceae bacterium]